ncbi:MAG: energy transducer TonB, partial [Steroidobacteraceae bacterium]
LAAGAAARPSSTSACPLLRDASCRVPPALQLSLQHAGTVWLSIEILPTGRVGLVRIDQSSGFVKLDESAVREARRWRMKPGVQDGVATSMWKRVPITFQLKN